MYFGLQKVVETILRELDPDGCQQRREHKLKRRGYHNSGPNAAWHADGYDKLKSYGFPNIAVMQHICGHFHRHKNGLH